MTAGIGKVDEATHETGGSFIVVDTGPWIFGRKVMLPAGVIRDVDLHSEMVFVDLTKDEIKNAPEFDEEDLPRAELPERARRVLRRSPGGPERRTHVGSFSLPGRRSPAQAGLRRSSPILWPRRGGGGRLAL